MQLSQIIASNETIAQALSLDLGKEVQPEDIEAHGVEGDYCGFFVAGKFIWMTCSQFAQYVVDCLEN